MDYKEKYNKLVESIKKLQEANPSDEGIQNWVNDNVPELAESEEKKILKELVSIVKSYRESCITEGNHRFDKCLAWLEKQCEHKVSVVDFKAEDWYVSKVDGKIYNAKFMEKPTNQARKLEIEKAAMSATGIIEQEEWFIKGAEWADKTAWKPNEEQMEALHDMSLTGNISYVGQGQTMIELYNDLKKLKGE